MNLAAQIAAEQDPKKFHALVVIGLQVVHL
jgi:hypothetical protein